MRTVPKMQQVLTRNPGSTAMLSRPLQSRFRRLYLPPYTEQHFLEVSIKVLPKLKIAHVIGKVVWDQGGDIRDVISIGKLVRKNDGPEEVEYAIHEGLTPNGEVLQKLIEVVNLANSIDLIDPNRRH
ncbi:MAG: hypothetical protein WBF33_32625 [Candidatus Nitrosopolaris sp.]